MNQLDDDDDEFVQAFLSQQQQQQSQNLSSSTATAASAQPLPSIQALDEGAVHRICSGQVVTDLSTAVKELLENAMDAGATAIEIRLINSGYDSIAVIDNGSGISASGYATVCSAHTTNKIAAFADIQSLSSYGFRGEALSSLCSIADVELSTRTAQESMAATLSFSHHGSLLTDRITLSARNVGSTVLVRKLFYTLPVRRTDFKKRLKSHYTAMLSTVQSYAIISRNIRISIHNTNTIVNDDGSSSSNRQTVLTTTGSSVIRDLITDVYGIKQSTALIEFDHMLADVALDASSTTHATAAAAAASFRLPADLQHRIRISGYISQPLASACRSSTDRQHVFINHRPIDLPKLTRAVNDCYRAVTSLNSNSFPFLLIDLQLPAGVFDVNVTPNKRTVFIQHEAVIISLVKQHINTLLAPAAAHTYIVKPIHAYLGLSTQNTNSNTLSPIKYCSQQFTTTAAFATAVEERSVVTRHDDAAKVKEEPAEHDDDDEYISAVAPAVVATTDAASDATAVADNMPPLSQALSQASARVRAASAAPVLWPLHLTIHNTELMDADVYRGDVHQHINKRPYSPLKRASSTSATAAVNNKQNEQHQVQQQRLQQEECEESDELPTKRQRAVEFSDDEASESTADSSERSGFHNSSNINNAVCIKSEPGTMIAAAAAAAIDLSLSSTHSFDFDMRYLELLYVSLDDAATAASATAIVSAARPNLQSSLHCRLSSMHNDDSCGSISSSSISSNSAHQGVLDAASALGLQLGVSTAAVVCESDLQRVIRKQDFLSMRVIGQFNLGFIITALSSSSSNNSISNDLFIIDQHASDEKYKFEQYQQQTVMHTQPLIAPLPLDLSAAQQAVIRDNMAVFVANGFRFSLDQREDDSERESESVSASASASAALLLTAVPYSKNVVFGVRDVHDLCSLLLENHGAMIRMPKILSMFASRACRSAVMIGDALEQQRMQQIVNRMSQLEHAWSCPHGRPTMRHLIDIALLPHAHEHSNTLYAVLTADINRLTAAAAAPSLLLSSAHVNTLQHPPAMSPPIPQLSQHPASQPTLFRLAASIR